MSYCRQLRRNFSKLSLAKKIFYENNEDEIFNRLAESRMQLSLITFIVIDDNCKWWRRMKWILSCSAVALWRRNQTLYSRVSSKFSIVALSLSATNSWTDSTSFPNTARFYQICFTLQRFFAVWSKCLPLNAFRGVISKEYLENYSRNEFNSNVMSYLSKLGKHHLGLSIPVSRSLAGIILQMDKSKTGFVLVGRLRWKP